MWVVADINNTLLIDILLKMLLQADIYIIYNYITELIIRFIPSFFPACSLLVLPVQ